MESENRPVRFDLVVPPELEAGAYSNFLSIWHTPHEFTFDFVVTQPGIDEPGEQRVPCRVVARVKVPVTVVFDKLRAMNENLTRYEGRLGVVQRLKALETPRPSRHPSRRRGPRHPRRA